MSDILMVFIFLVSKYNDMNSVFVVELIIFSNTAADIYPVVMGYYWEGNPFHIFI